MELEGIGTFIFILVASLVFVFFMTRPGNTTDQDEPPGDELGKR